MERGVCVMFVYILFDRIVIDFMLVVGFCFLKGWSGIGIVRFLNIEMIEMKVRNLVGYV